MSAPTANHNPRQENEFPANSSAGPIYAIAGSGVIPGRRGIVFAGSGSGLLHSTDGGQSWQDALSNLNLPEPLPVMALTLSPAFEQDGLVLAGAPGGILRSADAGQSWQVVQLPPPPPVVTALAVSQIHSQETGAFTLFAGTMEDGVLLSTGGGLGWTAWNFGLLDLNVLCLAVSPDDAQDETLFAGTDSGIFRSTNGGRAWREVALPFGFDAVLCLAFAPRPAGPSHFDEDPVLYAGTESQGLWVLKGESGWSQIGQFDEPVNAVLPRGDEILVLAGAALFRRSARENAWTNALPPSFAGREVSAVFAPQEDARNHKALVGFVDGSIKVVTLNV